MSAQELPAITTPEVARPQRPAENHLRLRGLTADGERLLLVDGVGLEFTVDIDARLRTALHGDPSRTETSTPASPAPAPRGPAVEKTMESTLRPRDIQARIRAGETPEAVAEAAQTTVDKVMPYAAPVLAEREHVAERALRASIRRPAAVRDDTGTAAGTSRTLGEAIGARLRGMNVDPDSVLWDAWRREDGRWSLTAAFSAGGTDGLAQLTYDQPGNFVLLDNDESRWLVGDHIEDTAADDAEVPETESRYLSAVPSEQLAIHDELGSDAIELVSDQPIEAYLDVQATEATAEIPTVPVEATVDPAADEPVARPPAKKKRSSVPSWDEIMFGGPSDEDSAER